MILHRVLRNATLCAAAAASLIALGCGTSPSDQQPQPPALGELAGINSPLTSFAQQITTPQSSLTLSPGQVLTVPVTVKNIGNQRLASAGKFPITLSYKWFESGNLLPIEGERTILPHALAPGEQVSFNAKLVAPAQGKDLTVKITLVQEGVAWFYTRGGQPLELKVKLKS